MRNVRRVLIFVLFVVSSSSVIAATPKFPLTGMTDAKVRAFFLKLQHAVDIHDVAELATMVSYPLVVDGKATVPNSKFFEEHYNDIFTKKGAAAVKRQQYGSLFGNDQGVMIGNSELWFSGVCQNTSCDRYHIRIVAINN